MTKKLVNDNIIYNTQAQHAFKTYKRENPWQAIFSFKIYKRYHFGTIVATTSVQTGKRQHFSWRQQSLNGDIFGNPKVGMFQAQRPSCKCGKRQQA